MNDTTQFSLTDINQTKKHGGTITKQGLLKTS